MHAPKKYMYQAKGKCLSFFTLMGKLRYDYHISSFGESQANSK